MTVRVECWEEELWAVIVRIDGEIQYVGEDDGDPWEIMRTRLEEAFLECDDGLGDGPEIGGGATTTERRRKHSR